MSETPKTATLLRQVRLRLRAALAARSARWAFWTLAAVYVVALVVSRSTGWAPHLFSLTSAVLIPVVALVVGAVLHRRPTESDAARAIDGHAATQDLFLTAALLDSAPGEFKPLVLSDAERRAAELGAERVVPWTGGPHLGRAALVAALVALAVVYVPQFDPFGTVAEAQKQEKRNERAAEARKATQARRAELRRVKEEEEESDAVDKAIEKLKAAFQQMKPQAKIENQERLREEQKDLGRQWRAMTEKSLREMNAQKESSQEFGAEDKETLRKFKKELQQGKTDSLKETLKKAEDDLQKLRKETDPVEKQDALQRLQKTVNDLEKLAEKELGSPALKSAVERMKSQLDAARQGELSEEERQALQESLDLTREELEQIAEQAGDLKDIEEALKLVQMAKKLNDGEKLDGEQCAGCKSLADYEALFKQLMDQNGEGEGEGEGAFAGRGQGKGGVAPEDDAADSDFKPEQSQSALTAGKILLSKKQKGMGEKNAADKEYNEAIRNVKQGYSEAILQERVPPGYHDKIKKYFDSLDAPPEAAKPPATKPAATKPAEKNADAKAPESK